MSKFHLIVFSLRLQSFGYYEINVDNTEGREGLTMKLSSHVNSYSP